MQWEMGEVIIVIFVKWYEKAFRTMKTDYFPYMLHVWNIYLHLA